MPVRRGAVQRVAAGVAVVVVVAGCSSGGSTDGHGAVARPSSGSGTGAAPGSTTTAAPHGPGHLLGLDLQTHRVDVLDDHATVVRHIDLPALNAPFAQPGPQHTLLVTDGATGYIVDAHRTTPTRFVLPSADAHPVAVPDGATIAVFVDATAEDVFVVNLASGAVTDGHDLVHDPKAIIAGTGRVSAGAIAFADVGPGDPATLLIPFDGRAPFTVPGTLVATDGTRTVTASLGASGSRQTVLTRYDAASAQGSVTADGAVVGGLLTGADTATVVTTDGEVESVDFGRKAAHRLAQLDERDGLVAPLSTDRLLVGDPQGSDPTLLIDAAGRVVTTLAPQGGHAVWLTSTNRTAPCVLLQPADPGGLTGATATLRDTETGAVRATLSPGSFIIDTPDGCTALTENGKAQVVLKGQLRTLDGYLGVSAVSPDLTHLVVQRLGGGSHRAVWDDLDLTTGKAAPIPAAQYVYVPDA